MKGIEIHDQKGGALSFDLAHILDALGSTVDGLVWSCSDVESFGTASSELHALADAGRHCSGAELRRISQGIAQTVDGEFRGLDSAGKPAVLIQAIDSTLWEVFATEPILDRVRRHFSDVRSAGYDAG